MKIVEISRTITAIVYHLDGRHYYAFDIDNDVLNIKLSSGIENSEREALEALAIEPFCYNRLNDSDCRYPQE